MKVKSVKCPYNPAHVMPEISLAGHLTKCSFRTPDFDCCKYNSMHIMHKTLLEDHQRSCKDKKNNEHDDDDWGFVDEVRENYREEVKAKRKERKDAKNKKQEVEEEEEDVGFVEPELAKMKEKHIEEILNLTEEIDKDATINTSTSKASKPKTKKIEKF